MASAVADIGKPGFSIREMLPEDVHDAGSVFYNAFYVDNLASGIPAAFNTPSPEAGRSLIGAMVAQSSYYKVAAFDCDSKLIGVACIEMGPVAVSPESSNRGVGRSLMKAVIQHALKMKSPSIRLNTSASNQKSFSLYASLGFRPVECTTAFTGTVKPDAGFNAASAVGIALDGISSRKMEEADVKACGEMFRKGMGYERENNIRATLAKWPEGCWVATTNDNTIVDYSTGTFMLGHTMATTEAAWVAVLSRAIQEKSGVIVCILIAGVYYPRLINWALATKLVLARHNWYMVIGDYRKPRDGFFWSPSMQH